MVSVAAAGRRVVLGTTLGALTSRDGRRFAWLCHAGVGYQPPYQPPYAVSPRGTILAASHEGLAVSRDGGCDFAFASGPLAGMYVDEVVAGPRGLVLAVTSTNSVENGLYRSDDDGRSFARTGLASRTVYFKSVVSRRDGLWVTGYDVLGRGANRVYRSRDGGRSFEELAVELPPRTRLIVLLVRGAAEDGPLYATGYVDERPTLLASDDGARWRVALSATELRGAATVPGGVLAVADGKLVRSGDGGRTFSPLEVPVRPRCVAAEGRTLLVCADPRADRALLARSEDGGRRWAVLGPGGLRAVAGPPRCARGSVPTRCDPLWPGLKKQLGL